MASRRSREALNRGKGEMVGISVQAPEGALQSNITEFGQASREAQLRQKEASAAYTEGLLKRLSSASSGGKPLDYGRFLKQDPDLSMAEDRVRAAEKMLKLTTGSLGVSAASLDANPMAKQAYDAFVAAQQSYSRMKALATQAFNKVQAEAEMREMTRKAAPSKPDVASKPKEDERNAGLASLFKLSGTLGPDQPGGSVVRAAQDLLMSRRAANLAEALGLLLKDSPEASGIIFKVGEMLDEVGE